MSQSTLRCAVYTRKSSEEGLDQAFNSLDAQREAGRDYIKSQKHQGWTAIATSYDDGGFSGGTTERPGLQRLLEDIRNGRVDVVLVYKVDRLSRSLADFARLMQLFDEHNVSFVSVTQQFNTTTSMGRLTLNMLLSFAQFEREVTGERIRDKIAATKKKGVWVGGRPPLGYRINPDGGDRRLVIIPEEAKVVRAIFDGYLKSGSLVGLVAEFKAAGYATRRWHSSRERWHGGRNLDSNFIYRILTNPVYIGLIAHTPGRLRGKAPSSASDPGASHTDLYPGLHEPIIDRAIWDRVDALMKRAERETSTRWTHTHLLKGKFRTFEGYAMSPSSVPRRPWKRNPELQDASPTAVPGERRVRYYLSRKACRQGYKSCPIKTINARHMDDLVRGLVFGYLKRAHGTDLTGIEPAARDHWVREVIERVVLAPDSMTMQINDARAVACAEHVAALKPPPSRTKNPRELIPTCPYTPIVEQQDGRTILTLRAQLKRHDGRRILLSPEGHDLLLTVNPDGRPIPRQHIVRAIGQAFAWHTALMRTRESVDSLALRAGVTDGHIHKRILLTRLSPTILGAALSGTLATSISLADLERAAEHLDWSLQAAELGPHAINDLAKRR